MRIRIVLGDNHAMVREGLIALLQRESDMEVLAQARNGLELVDRKSTRLNSSH